MLAIYSTLLPSLTKSLNILVPQSGYQLVFPSFGSHNHLGDFLLISLVTCFYFLITKGGPRILYIHNKPILIYLLIIFLTPYFIFSYSRSAYVSLALTLIMMFIYFAKEKYFKTSTTVFGLIVLIITLCSGFLFLVSNTSIKPLMTKNINNDLSKNHNLTQKYPSGNRQQYLYQGISSLRESPLGVGAGNFVYASKKYKGSIEWWTETSHNIFVDVFVENGLISGFLFLIIISILFLKSNKDAYFFVALALLINFQSDYTYRIYPIFLLFCMFIGLAYRGNIKSRFDKTKNKFQPSI
ncbi:MAG TPA: O-antigen ligase family protein [Patescibacteria group bacterium]|nr:O-antigen ligase family protein [Patescibacteria group bacterium]